MNKDESNLWAGLSDEARNALTERDYKAGSLAQRIAYSGIDASELAAADRSRPEVKRAWIPGVEIFRAKNSFAASSRSFRRICPPRRGSSGENRILAEAMVGRAHVCTEREGISCASTEHSARYDRREMAAPFVHARAARIIRCVGTMTSSGTSCFFSRDAWR